MSKLPQKGTPGPDGFGYPILVPGIGPAPASGMIVGEAPGRNEIKAGQPFIGSSGAVLEQVLSEFGVSRSWYYITNVYKGDVGEGNRNPTREEVAAHHALLSQEFEVVAPKAVLLLGRFAAESFLDQFNKMGDVADKAYQLLDGTWYYPCYHPAATLYNRKLRGAFAAQVYRFIERTFR